MSQVYSEKAEEETVSFGPDSVVLLSDIPYLTSLSASPSIVGRSSSKELIAALKEAGIRQVALSDVQELPSDKLTPEAE